MDMLIPGLPDKEFNLITAIRDYIMREAHGIPAQSIEAKELLPFKQNLLDAEKVEFTAELRSYGYNIA